jgi:hypothetical protein
MEALEDSKGTEAPPIMARKPLTIVDQDRYSEFHMGLTLISNFRIPRL